MIEKIKREIENIKLVISEAEKALARSETAKQKRDYASVIKRSNKTLESLYRILREYSDESA